MQRTSQFIDYTNSGGITKKNDMVQNIHEIQQKIIRAKEIKGALCLNNANAYGGSWRTPALDLAFQNKHGGETGQRFYSKFPIYRPRGKAPPDVKDDIGKIWQEQISLQPKNEQAGSPHNKLNAMFGMRSDHAMNETWKTSKRSLSNFVGPRGARDSKFFKNTGASFIYPMRQRFNEDAESTIKEQKVQQTSLTKKTLQPLGNANTDLKSNVSKVS